MKQALGLVRLMMILSSLTPLFLLWSIRGIKPVPDCWLWVVCGILVIIPNLLLIARWRIALRRADTVPITVDRAEDHRDHLLVYLFAMLVPLYDANLSELRDLWAAVTALLFIIFLFWHLNLHYMNVSFAVMGYRVFTIERPDRNGVAIEAVVVLTRRNHIPAGDIIHCLRLSDTVLVEAGR